MCGRVVVHRSWSELWHIFNAMNAVPNVAPSWNVAPSQAAPVVRLHPTEGVRHLDALTWGLVPHWSKDPKAERKPINARSETVATSPLFRQAFARRRCIVPVDAFYEWQATPGGKIPNAIAREDAAPMALAGVWEGWRGADGQVLRSFAILTTTACAALVHLHERMPVVLEPADWPLWLGEVEGAHAELMRPSSASFRTWRVSTRVNNVRNDGPELLEEVA